MQKLEENKRLEADWLKATNDLDRIQRKSQFKGVNSLPVDAYEKEHDWSTSITPPFFIWGCKR